MNHTCVDCGRETSFTPRCFACMKNGWPRLPDDMTPSIGFPDGFMVDHQSNKLDAVMGTHSPLTTTTFPATGEFFPEEYL